MRTKEYILEKISRMSYSEGEHERKKIEKRKELDELAHLLKNNENLDYIVRGFFNGDESIIVITDLRVLILHRGLLHHFKQAEIALDQIDLVRIEKGLDFGKVFIDKSFGESMKLSCIFNSDVNIINRMLHTNIDNYKLGLLDEETLIKANDLTHITGNPNLDIVTKLKELAELKNTGILTDEEFLKAKTKILE